MKHLLIILLAILSVLAVQGQTWETGGDPGKMQESEEKRQICLAKSLAELRLALDPLETSRQQWHMNNAKIYEEIGTKGAQC